MKKEIKIVIPDGLTEKQELAEIATKLRQKTLASNGRQIDHKRIGVQTDVKHLTTTITITRTGEKPIEMIDCNVCGLQYQSNLSMPVWVNYGGKNKAVKVCSRQCQEDLISICGTGRASFKKSKLTPLRYYTLK